MLVFNMALKNLLASFCPSKISQNFDFPDVENLYCPKISLFSQSDLEKKEICFLGICGCVPLLWEVHLGYCNSSC